MLSSFMEMLQEVTNEGEKLFNRIKDKKLFRRVVSAAFLIARADGVFDADEKSGLAKIIQKHLGHFSIQDILSVLGDCEDKIAFDETMGISEIMDDIGGASGEDAALIIRVACFIGAADGDFDPDERKVAHAMAVRMGVEPSRYGL